MVLKLATRGSTLAHWQAELVRDRLLAAHRGLRVEIRIVRTTGDRVTDAALSSIGGRGLFTAEVDRALLDHDADLAVHSLKDLPTEAEPGLDIGAVLAREDPRDVVVFAETGATLDGLPPGGRVGTSSLRRKAQLLARRPDLRVVDLRGNLDTRLRRVADGDYDAAILAAAGLLRLGRSDAIGEWLEPEVWLPAVGQGALAVTVRADDDATLGLLAALEDPATRVTTTAERAFLNELEGGCQVPIGALATLEGDTLRVHGLVASLDGATMLRDECTGARDDADATGRVLAAALRARGADDLLESIRAAQPVPGASPP